MATEFRTLVNVPGYTFDEDDDKRIYAEDWAQLTSAVNSLEEAIVAVPDSVVANWVDGGSVARTMRFGKDHVADTYAQLYSDATIKIWGQGTYCGYFVSTGFSYNDGKGMVLGAGGSTKANSIWGRDSQQRTSGTTPYIQCGMLAVADVNYFAPNYIAGRFWIIADGSDIGYSFNHPAQSNPTLFIHSANQSTTEWLGLTHDQTDGVLTTGKGDLKVSSYSGYLNVTTGFKVGGTLFFNNGTYNFYHDGTPGQVETITIKGGIVTGVVVTPEV